MDKQSEEQIAMSKSMIEHENEEEDKENWMK